MKDSISVDMEGKRCGMDGWKKAERPLLWGKMAYVCSIEGLLPFNYWIVTGVKGDFENIFSTFKKCF